MLIPVICTKTRKEKEIRYEEKEVYTRFLLYVDHVVNDYVADELRIQRLRIRPQREQKQAAVMAIMAKTAVMAMTAVMIMMAMMAVRRLTPITWKLSLIIRRSPPLIPSEAAARAAQQAGFTRWSTIHW